MGIFRKMSPLGLEKEALGGQTAKKSYVAPTTKVVKFVVEGGFAGSNPEGKKFAITGISRMSQSADPDYVPQEWGYVGTTTTDDSWF